MRFLGHLLAWVLLFSLFLVLRFPYQAVFEQAVARIEASTGADLAWEEARVGMLGVDLRGFSLRMPSGARFSADRARFRPAWGGMTALLDQTQAKGRATAGLRGSTLELHAEDLQVDTGSRDLATVRLTGDLSYDMNQRTGGGEVRMAVPDLSKVLPLPVPALEVGAKVTLRSVAGAGPPTSEVNAELSLFGEGISGGGTVRMQSQPGGGPPALNGSLKINAGTLGTHEVRVGGTWGRPEWSLAQGASL